MAVAFRQHSAVHTAATNEPDLSGFRQPLLEGWPFTLTVIQQSVQ
jgi:hypothetical protein